jgi:hypothetical protein
MKKTIYWTIAIVAVGALGAVGAGLLSVEEAEASRSGPSCKQEAERGDIDADECHGCPHADRLGGPSKGHERTEGQCSHESE